MTPPAWTVVHFEEAFITPLERQFLEIKGQLQTPPSNEAELLRLFAEWDDLKKLTQAIIRLKESDDLISFLVPACEQDGTIIPEYFVLRCGAWCAYYHVDADERLCTGLLVRSGGAQIQNLGIILLEVFTRFWGGTK